VEGPTPVKPSASRRAKRRDAVGLDLEPVTYVAKITYSEDTIDLADKILVFVKLDPGPERRLDPPYVEEAGSYVSPGK
jgi:hypothetical protein